MKKEFINALYDLKSGKTLIPHPTEKNIFVSPKHYVELLKGEVSKEQKCTYTEEKACKWYMWNAEEQDYICVQPYTIKTCDCD